MGNYRYRVSGDKCPDCKKGNLKSIHIPRTTGSVIVSGLMGFFVADNFFNDERNYLECNKCCKQCDRKYWDSNVAEDKPMTLKDYKVMAMFIGATFLCLGMAYGSVVGIAWLLGRFI